ncbi:MAG: hypothetical protein HYX68_29770 [Planctomycetes bacterium]|nr:hypothetical protein [Planctomycetota bacterium]
MQQVHLRVNDAETGKPTPVRLRITDADGTYYAPYGRLTEFATGANQDVGGNVLIGAKKWCYIDGACEILLPPGQLQIEITKGFEYKPLDETITLLPGKMALRFTMERWCDLRKEGWYSGDTTVHMLSPDAALLEGQAEDVAVVNLLADERYLADKNGNWHPAIPNILSFSGQQFARQGPGCGVAVNTLNVHHWHGNLALLHCHRPVYPLTLGLDRGDNFALADWCDQCHRKNGLVVWTGPHRTLALGPGEPLADLILGKFDAFDVRESSEIAFYFALYSCGLAVPLVGGSRKGTNAQVLGSMRTYAHGTPGNEFGYAAWIEAVRAGRTFISTGPMLHFTIDGEVPSTAPARPTASQPRKVRVEAKHSNRISCVELLWNGSVVAEVHPPADSPCVAVLEHELIARESGWVAARCVGVRDDETNVFAHTSAIPFQGADPLGWAEPRRVNLALNDLDAMLRWAKEQARCDTSAQRERLCGIFEEARTMLAKRLS